MVVSKPFVATGVAALVLAVGGVGACQLIDDEGTTPTPALSVQSASQPLSSPLRSNPPPAQELQPGVVLLLPGYGGVSDSLRDLQQALQRQGRDARIVEPAGDNTGDLAASAALVQVAVTQAINDGAASVDVVGFSAGGLVLRDWARTNPDTARWVRRVVTLGSPHHGTNLATTAFWFQRENCPLACEQMTPGSVFMNTLNSRENQAAEEKLGARRLSIMTVNDKVVTPMSTSRWAPALNVELQQVCPSTQVEHIELPNKPLPVGLVEQELSGPGLRPDLGPAQCQELTQSGHQALGPQSTSPATPQQSEQGLSLERAAELALPWVPFLVPVNPPPAPSLPSPSALPVPTLPTPTVPGLSSSLPTPARSQLALDPLSGQRRGL